MPKPKGWSLSARVIAMQVAIVLAAVAAANATLAWVFSKSLDREYGRFSIAVAHTVAALPQVRAAFGLPNPSAALQPLAETVRKESGVSFVVIANRDQVRYTHPNPARIGQKLSTDPAETDASQVLNGGEFVGIEQGSLGRSVRGKVPIYDDQGAIIGVVSVGVLMDTLRQVYARSWPLLLLGLAFGLALGAGGSLLLARRIKRDTLGLEPAQIAAAYEQREAMLEAMREGVIAVDAAGRITLVNDEARRLLDLDSSCLGAPVTEVLPGTRLPEVAQSSLPQFDESFSHNGRQFIVNRVPMQRRGQLVGAAATFRDQTELVGLARELASVKQYAEALRAQSHEFTNKLHTISGMLELGWSDEAVRFIAQVRAAHQQRNDTMMRGISSPEVTALLIGKVGVAAERGVTLSVEPNSRLQGARGMAEELVTIVGNLVENAVEAVAPLPVGRRQVSVLISDRSEDHLLIRVRDNGPGVPAALREQIFAAGYTTKAAGTRGLGLSLVKTCVERLGGEIRVRNRHGAIFTVELPLAAHAPKGRRSEQHGAG